MNTYKVKGNKNELRNVNKIKNSTLSNAVGGWVLWLD